MYFMSICVICINFAYMKFSRTTSFQYPTTYTSSLTPSYHTGNTDSADVSLLLTALDWPRQKLFPILDLTKVIIKRQSFQQVSFNLRLVTHEHSLFCVENYYTHCPLEIKNVLFTCGPGSGSCERSHCTVTLLDTFWVTPGFG